MEQNKINKGRFVKGQKMSEETKAKMKGRTPWNKGKSDIYEGEKNPFFGRKHTEETKEKNRIAHIGKKINEKQLEALDYGRRMKKGQKAPWVKNNHQIFKKGMLHPYWVGGGSSWRGKEWKKLREKIKQRDSFKCFYCGKTELLSVHHIIPYRETQDNSEENLITLCRSCHVFEDIDYIINKENKDDWIKILCKGKLKKIYGNFSDKVDFEAKLIKAFQVRKTAQDLIGVQ